MAAGKSQLEGWLTPRIIRTDDFLAMDTRVVWTHGVARTLESQLSMDFDWQSTTLATTFDPRITSLWRWTTWRDPSPFAVSGIGRATVGFNSFELEARLVADLRIDKVLVAINVAAARSLFWNGRTGVDTHLEENFGIRYQLTAGAAVGLELKGRSGWEGRAHAGTALYVGPAFTFTPGPFWLTLGGYWQAASWKADADKGTAERQELRDNERFQVRAVFGFPAL